MSRRKLRLKFFRTVDPDLINGSYRKPKPLERVAIEALVMLLTSRYRRRPINALSKNSIFEADRVLPSEAIDMHFCMRIAYRIVNRYPDRTFYSRRGLERLAGQLVHKLFHRYHGL